MCDLLSSINWWDSEGTLCVIYFRKLVGQLGNNKMKAAGHCK